MVNENALRETLIAVFEHLKKQNELVSTLNLELKAWRETMREMDGDLFAATLDRKRQGISSLPSNDQLSEEYNATIQKLKDGLIC